MNAAQHQFLVSVLHWLACVCVLAEAVNKLERADLFAGRAGLQRLIALRWLFTPWWWKRPHVVTVFKVAGWLLLAIGAGGGVVLPLLQGHIPPSVQDAAVVAGFALLIVRSRLKEGP